MTIEQQRAIAIASARARAAGGGDAPTLDDDHEPLRIDDLREGFADVFFAE